MFTLWIIALSILYVYSIYYIYIYIQTYYNILLQVMCIMRTVIIIYAYAMFNVPSHSLIENKLNLEPAVLLYNTNANRAILIIMVYYGVSSLRHHIIIIFSRLQVCKIVVNISGRRFFSFVDLFRRSTNCLDDSNSRVYLVYFN